MAGGPEFTVLTFILTMSWRAPPCPNPCRVLGVYLPGPFATPKKRNSNRSGKMLSLWRQAHPHPRAPDHFLPEWLVYGHVDGGRYYPCSILSRKPQETCGQSIAATDELRPMHEHRVGENVCAAATELYSRRTCLEKETLPCDGGRFDLIEKNTRKLLEPATGLSQKWLRTDGLLLWCYPGTPVEWERLAIHERRKARSPNTPIMTSLERAPFNEGKSRRRWEEKKGLFGVVKKREK